MDVARILEFSPKQQQISLLRRRIDRLIGIAGARALTGAEKSELRALLPRWRAEESLRTLAQCMAAHEAERVTYEALPVAAKIEMLRGRLAATIARWEAGEHLPYRPRAEVWERYRRQNIAIQILELQGAPADSVADMHTRNAEAVRRGKGLAFNCESPENLARWGAATAPAQHPKPAADFDDSLGERLPFRQLIDRLSDYRAQEREVPDPSHW
jgi:hypothetical protein